MNLKILIGQLNDLDFERSGEFINIKGTGKPESGHLTKKKLGINYGDIKDQCQI